MKFQVFTLKMGAFFYFFQNINILKKWIFIISVGFSKVPADD